ncbi:SPP1 family predicted phage head-tail adaptor [Novosphingobium sp. SG751A]|uniref:phage head closure protein n=1 Tax=Novosphingobium sp. SG751A TaxID=2587000 RepID=UPI001553CB9C|nr:phage head closure protein [Novosphingobium sp. SG751A]NOW44100.1 SPP1 family predicted phage head-tail adaptor [Novosphingobium sp. SG751A]
MADYGRNSGALRDRIQLRRMQLVDDGKGGQTKAPIIYAQPYARIEDLGGRESVIAHALQGIKAVRITIRWQEGVSEEDQVILPDGSEVTVTAPPTDPDYRRRWLVIMASNESVVRAE